MIEFHIVKLLSKLLLPPGGVFTLFLSGMVIRHYWPRVGLSLMIASGVLFYLVSIPPVALELRETLIHRYPPLIDTGDLPPRIGAIVILGAGMGSNPEFGGLDVGPVSLARLRYAARLHRQTGLPLLVSANEELADVMRRVLQHEFRVSVRWLEGQSLTTADNARLSKRILAKEGIDAVLLVTNEYHMHRATKAFEKAGFEVFPAPTLLIEGRPKLVSKVYQLLPSASALYSSRDSLYEYMGRIWYRLRYSSKD